MELDLHVHSNYSFDSRLHPADIIDAAIEAGLSGVAICDHNNCGGGLLAKKIAPKGFFVIPGIELGCEVVGDIIGLFITKIDTEEFLVPLKTRKVEDFIKAVKAQNGLLILPHPSDIGMKYLESEKLISYFDGIETYNSRRAHQNSISEGDGEERFADYAKRHRLAVTAGSDAHTAGEVGQARTIIHAEDEAGIRKAFASRSTIVKGNRTGSMPKYISQAVRFLGIGGTGKKNKN